MRHAGLASDAFGQSVRDYKVGGALMKQADTALVRACRERGIAATRQLAKRQLTWLRSMPARVAVACDEPSALDEVTRRVLQAVGARP